MRCDRRLFRFATSIAMQSVAFCGAVALSHATDAQPANAHETHAHVHGIASLQVTVDGRTLSLDFDTPLESLIGFEHAPRTESEKAAVRNMAERLRSPAMLFLPTAEALCTPASTKLESPILDDAKRSAAAGDKKTEHADLSAEYTFTCERPERLRDLELKHFDSFRQLLGG